MGNFFYLWMKNSKSYCQEFVETYKIHMCRKKKRKENIKMETQRGNIDSNTISFFVTTLITNRQKKTIFKIFQTQTSHKC